MKTLSTILFCLSTIAGAANAATTFEATISGLDGNAGPFAALGIQQGGELRIFFTLNDDQTQGAATGEDSFGPNTTKTSHGGSAWFYNLAGQITFLEDVITQTYDGGLFDYFSISGNIAPMIGAGQKYSLDWSSLTTNNSNWDRATPITADILNTFDFDNFYLEDGTGSTGISAYSVAYRELPTSNTPAPVPLPGGLPLLAGGVLAAAFLGRKRSASNTN